VKQGSTIKKLISKNMENGFPWFRTGTHHRL